MPRAAGARISLSGFVSATGTGEHRRQPAHGTVGGRRSGSLPTKTRKWSGNPAPVPGEAGRAFFAAPPHFDLTVRPGSRPTRWAVAWYHSRSCRSESQPHPSAAARERPQLTIRVDHSTFPQTVFFHGQVVG